MIALFLTLARFYRTLLLINTMTSMNFVSVVIIRFHQISIPILSVLQVEQIVRRTAHFLLKLEEIFSLRILVFLRLTF